MNSFDREFHVGQRLIDLTEIAIDLGTLGAITPEDRVLLHQVVIRCRHTLEQQGGIQHTLGNLSSGQADK